MFTPLFLFGIGPLELGVILVLALLFLGPTYIIPWVSAQSGRVAGAIGRSTEEFEAGREAE